MSDHFAHWDHSILYLLSLVLGWGIKAQWLDRASKQQFAWTRVTNKPTALSTNNTYPPREAPGDPAQGGGTQPASHICWTSTLMQLEQRASWCCPGRRTGLILFYVPFLCSNKKKIRGRRHFGVQRGAVIYHKFPAQHQKCTICTLNKYLRPKMESLTLIRDHTWEKLSLLCKLLQLSYSRFYEDVYKEQFLCHHTRSSVWVIKQTETLCPRKTIFLTLGSYWSFIPWATKWIYIGICIYRCYSNTALKMCKVVLNPN